METLRAYYVRFEHVMAYGKSPLLLVVRLYWGWQFMQTGWGKLTSLPKVTEFFASLNIPFPGLNAGFCAGLEFFGGLLLIVGLGSRLIGLLFAVDMVVAYLTADRESLLAVFSNPEKFYGADPYPFLASALLIAVFGAGVFSLDYLLAGKREI